MDDVEQDKTKWMRDIKQSADRKTIDLPHRCCYFVTFLQQRVHPLQVSFQILLVAHSGSSAAWQLLSLPEPLVRKLNVCCVAIS